MLDGTCLLQLQSCVCSGFLQYLSHLTAVLADAPYSSVSESACACTAGLPERHPSCSAPEAQSSSSATPTRLELTSLPADVLRIISQELCTAVNLPAQLPSAPWAAFSAHERSIEYILLFSHGCIASRVGAFRTLAYKCQYLAWRLVQNCVLAQVLCLP